MNVCTSKYRKYDGLHKYKCCTKWASSLLIWCSRCTAFCSLNGVHDHREGCCVLCRTTTPTARLVDIKEAIQRLGWRLLVQGFLARNRRKESDLLFCTREGSSVGFLTEHLHNTGLNLPSMRRGLLLIQWHNGEVWINQHWVTTTCWSWVILTQCCVCDFLGCSDKCL